jgi:predicted dehydrogenase
VSKVKAGLKRTAKPLRLGVLSAANINYIAIIDPVQTHPDAIICAIAARSRSKAQAQIDKYKLGQDCKAYGSYAELVEDPEIEAVYIPLPNGLHAEWAIKAMEAGKHVLIEKPITSNAEEVRSIQTATAKTGKVSLEAFHWRFHPAAHLVKEIVESAKYGRPLSIYAKLVAPAGQFAKDDIRFKYELGGGACMDLTYIFCASAYYASPDIAKATFDVLETTPRLHQNDKRIDEAMDSKFIIEQEGCPPVKCHVECDEVFAPFLGFIPRFWAMSPVVVIELENAKIEFDNFVVPSYTHSITITEKGTNGKLTSKKHTEKLFTDGPQWGTRGEAWWTTYRYQLEAFVDAVRAKEKGEEYTGPWMSLEESEKVMELIDVVYDKAGLPRRGL